MVIVQHCSGSVKAYIDIPLARGCVFAVPKCCPHPDCRAAGSLIRWDSYERGAVTVEADYRIRIWRVRCTVCGRTHSLLPDFLHLHRHFVIRLLQHVVSLYLLVGLGWRRLLRHLHGRGPARSTVREWVASFAYGAGYLLLDRLPRCLFAIAPDAELPKRPPKHLGRVPDSSGVTICGKLTPSGCWPNTSTRSSKPGCHTCTFRPASSSPSYCIGCKARVCHRACSGRRACPPPQHSPSNPLASLPPHLCSQSDHRIDLF